MEGITLKKTSISSLLESSIICKFIIVAHIRSKYSSKNTIIEL